jgi:two-component system chemotaxis response regulator CheV
MNLQSERINETTKLAISNKVELLTFEIWDKKWVVFWINIFKVREIAPLSSYPITKISGDSRPFVEWVISHREWIVPVVSLVKWIEGTSAWANEDDKIVICQYNKHTVWFLISRDASILRKDWGEIIESDYLKESGKITNVTKISDKEWDGEKLVFILDVEQLLEEMMPSATESQLSWIVIEKLKDKVWKILVAEDSQTARNHIKKTLDMLGVDDYIIFENGKLLLDYVKNADVDNIWLVITDLEMPEVSWFIVIKELKWSDSTKDIAVVVNSSMSWDNSIREATMLWADWFISKTSIEELANIIGKLARTKPESKS